MYIRLIIIGKIGCARDNYQCLCTDHFSLCTTQDHTVIDYICLSLDLLRSADFISVTNKTLDPSFDSFVPLAA